MCLQSRRWTGQLHGHQRERPDVRFTRWASGYAAVLRRLLPDRAGARPPNGVIHHTRSASAAASTANPPELNYEMIFKILSIEYISHLHAAAEHYQQARRTVGVHGIFLKPGDVVGK